MWWAVAVALACLTAASACVVWLARRWRRARGYWTERGVPHRPPNPFWGSLASLKTENPAVWMKSIYKEFRAPYVGVWLFWRPALIINSPEISRRVLVKDFDVFRNRFLNFGNSDPHGGLSLFVVDDPIWSSVRRRLTQVFTGAKLRVFNEHMSSKANELIQRISNEINDGQKTELKLLYTDYTTDVIGKAVLGVKTDAILTGTDPLRKVTDDLMTYSVWRAISWSSIFFFPELVDVFRFKFFPESSTRFFRKIFRTVVAQRGGFDKEPSEVRDLLDVLLKMKCDSAKTGEVISEDMLLGQAMIMLMGGFDTSSTTLSFATYELAFHPHVQERMYLELREAKGRSGEAPLDGAALADLPYFNAVIKETLRKYPTMGWLARIAAQDYQIDDNLTISKGTPVYVNAVGMHYDPEYFPEPEKFDPERFLPENENNLKPFTYMPFGEGPRNCIGKRFAYNAVRQALAAVSLRFEVRAPPGACAPHLCRIESKGLLLAPGQPLRVHFVPRTDA